MDCACMAICSFAIGCGEDADTGSGATGGDTGGGAATDGGEGAGSGTQ